MKEKITEYPIVYLKWLDHNTHDGMWIELDEIPKSPLTVETVGFLVGEDDISYQVVGTTCETGDKEIVRSFFYIIKGCVEQFSVLKK